ncbi:MAG: hypothetical protein VYD64_10740 [Pseudomonadota bacterium]|nr:hypothetical protein [Pseudomonadota bacterium]
MSGHLRAVALFAVTLALPVAGLAQEAGSLADSPQPREVPLEDDGLRYAMRSVEDGVVRLDRETGAMDLCKVRHGRLVCRLAIDERDSYESEIADLQARIDAFEAAREAERKPVPPDDPRMREAMRQAGKALRRFFDAVGELREDFEKRQESE